MKCSVCLSLKDVPIFFCWTMKDLVIIPFRWEAEINTSLDKELHLRVEKMCSLSKRKKNDFHSPVNNKKAGTKLEIQKANE